MLFASADSLFVEMKGGKMKKWKRIISLLVLSCLICGTMVHAAETETPAEEELLYEKMLEAYLDGEEMEDWAVEARKQIAKELNLSEYLDERSFLSIDYRNTNKIGRDGDIADWKLSLLVEMATSEEVEAIFMKSQMQTFNLRSIISEQSVAVTQMARVSGSGNGYFTVSGANSYGYCAQNSYDFWNNNTTKYGAAYEWDNATVRKALYYGPGGPGYTGPYYGSLGADMDYVTFAVGKLNGDTANNTKATAYINFVSGKADPLSSGYRAYKADIASPYQDVAFLSYSSVISNLTISKRSQTDLYSGDGYKYLTGATFELYAWTGSDFSKYVTTSVDNGDGTYTFRNVNKSLSADATFLAKEVKAKEGYSTEYVKFCNKDITDFNNYGGRQFELHSDGSWSCYSLTKDNFAHPDWGFTFLDYPNDVTVTITKQDSETGEKLTGAEFELWAYQGNPIECTYKVGDFTDHQDGTYSISFPFDIATFTEGSYWYDFKEIKAPDGYVMDAYAASGHSICFDQNGKGTTEFVVGNKPLPKISIVKKQEGTDVVIPNVAFEHKKPNGTTEVLSTDENGKLSFKGLGVGAHEIREVSVMDGYLLNENVVAFSVGTDYEITHTSKQDDSKGKVELYVTESGNIEMTMYDKVVPFNLVIHKQSSAGDVLEGAEFALCQDAACTNVLLTGITDTNGKLEFEGLEAQTKYYLKEIKAPTGYGLPTDEEGNAVITEIEIFSIPARNVFELYVNGSKYDFDAEGAFALMGTKAVREVNMTVVNEVGNLLPYTGSSVTLDFILAAVLLLTLSTKKQYRKGKI